MYADMPHTVFPSQAHQNITYKGEIHMGIVKNPILRGFHPDPSIIKVGDTFYIANSTFEYYPGVKVSSSRDLSLWKTETYILNESRLLDMRSQDSSSGVWAPCLSYDNGKFYLVYSNIVTFKLEGEEGIPFHDDYNFLITADHIHGPWSDPVFLTSGGFDASLFHDENRKWLVYAKWIWRKESGNEHDHSAGFFGIVIQQYDEGKQKLVGEETIIFKGTEKGLVEGPKIYKVGELYYLLTAEGGTEYNHASTIARSTSLLGPYTVREGNPYLITSAHNKSLTFQKVGHGSLVEAENNKWYFVHLCGRPIITDLGKPLDRNNAFCILGRETALQGIEWINGWPFIIGGGYEPLDFVDVHYDTSNNDVMENITYTFDDEIHEDFNNLRIKMGEEYFTIKERMGYLRIKGWESIVSRHKQATLVRRQQAFKFECETYLEFSPYSFQQMAGLIYRYNEANQYYLYIGFDQTVNKKYVDLMIFNKGKCAMLKSKIKCIHEAGISLRLSVNIDQVTFYYKEKSGEWKQIGETYDTTILSDEYAWPGFTGAMVGMTCQDFSGRHLYADFKYLKYQEFR